MKKEFYDKLAEPFRADPKKKQALLGANRLITGLDYLAYPGLLLLLFVKQDRRFFRILLIPLCAFAGVTAFRDKVNAPRPYEVWEEPPLIEKDTKGHSFPSRHVFSSFLIAMAWLCIFPPIGMVLLVTAVFLAAVRVISGVHFLRDVIAGAGAGIGAGLLFFIKRERP